MPKPNEKADKKGKRVFDGTLLTMLGILALFASLAYFRGGNELALAGLRQGGDMLLRFGPVIIVSLLAAGFADRLLPREMVQQWLGEDAGLRGIVLATGAGMITPSGPFVSMPIAAVLLRSGASNAAVVAFVAAWALLAVHRLIAWEVPLLGWRFALVRYGVCLALPILAGLGSRLLLRS
jgi:uncharacterized membrane protein YraQ (UPF0718 family)